ncbi:succinyldiaminopimelate transaminase [Haloglycomyces albus]|uniref:succinyldiaminopimelate transaminase n=1 Tax=Haloglycomyces albus TaxID=526067 RepID=UPI00046CBBC0|nr:succinyldiaminopimelate transaminase [Haloglycomyces albus]
MVSRSYAASPARRLPRFPWDRLEPFKKRAAAHANGLLDLSVGAPVDPVADSVRKALENGASRPGYPATAGSVELREAMRAWLDRTVGADVSKVSVLPTVGSKELVANLPTQLGVVSGDDVVYPSIAYPTYEIGALLAGASPVPVADPREATTPPRLAWINYPSNPTGEVASVQSLRQIVAWARQNDVVLVSDECYYTLGWDEEHPPVSILDPRVNDGDLRGLLSAFSLSKRSNLAGYRSAFIAGDPELIADLLEIRRHAGYIMPWPVQTATVAALEDEAHANEQKERYRRRRSVLLDAFRSAGFRIDHSHAGLYLWASRDEDCWDTVADLAERGILAVPGEFYGADGHRHVRVSLTVGDAQVDQVGERLR